MGGDAHVSPLVSCDCLRYHGKQMRLLASHWLVTPGVASTIKGLGTSRAAERIQRPWVKRGRKGPLQAKRTENRQGL